MDKTMKKVVALCIILATVLCGFAACKEPEPTHIDYAASVKLDMTSATAKEEATVRMLIDGDTSHFDVSKTVSETGVLKARYLAINTPETTGKVEPWGKMAAAFTAEKLSGASSIILESDNGTWNPDSTGDRYLVWVWYKPEGASEYRNLNIEILQNGLAIASDAANNRYGETCLAAIEQAEREDLYVHSTAKDPDFYVGSAIPLTLRDLRANIADYVDKRVTFEAVVTKNSGGAGVYVEAYDVETDMYNGMYVYYGYGLGGEGIEILSIGNRVRIVGVVSLFNGSYQITDINYRVMRPNDPNNVLQLDEEYHEAAYAELDINTFLDGEVTVSVGEDETKKLPYAQMLLGSTVSMKGLKVLSVYTTTDPASSSVGAITLTCELDGREITLRTDVLTDENGATVTEDVFVGKTIDVRGIVDYYSDRDIYQIKVLLYSDITIKN